MTENTAKAAAGQGGGASIHIAQVSKRFSESVLVVDNLDLTIESGEFVTLLGPSGCGKSTLLRLIAGLDKSYDGKLTIDSFGRRFFRGFVFQDAALVPWRTVLDNVSLPLQLMGVQRREAGDRASAALMQVGLGDALKKYPAQLSGGMKMRVSVARAMVVQPSLLLLDEPFAALDENTRHRLQERLRELWLKAKMTTVFVTHSVPEAVFLSNRSIVFSPRPARKLADLRIELPVERTGLLRTDPQFIRQMEIIYRSFNTMTESV